jgi:lysophospholipase L1-like esterase
MRYFLGLLLILALVFSYLYFSYNHIFEVLAKQQTSGPFDQQRYVMVGFGTSSLKFAILGDDLAAGVGSTDVKNTYPYAIAEELAKRADVLTFVNLATPGATAESVVENQVKQIVLEKPQYVFVQVGLKDLHSLVKPDDFKKSYEKIAAKLNSITAKVFLINIPYLASPSLVWFPFNAGLDIRTRQYNEAIKNIARQNGYIYIDLHAKTLESLNSQTDLYSVDLIHPNEKEYINWGNIIINYLKT